MITKYQEKLHGLIINKNFFLKIKRLARILYKIPGCFKKFNA